MSGLLEFFSRFQGELAALVCAAIWSVATLYFKMLGRRISSSYLNFFKTAITLPLLLLTVIVGRHQVPHLLSNVSFYLFLSGLVGIGIGDTAYFESLRYLGARRSLLMGILAPPATGLMAYLFIGEALAPAAWLGIVLTISGVAWVVSERTPDSGPQEPGHLKKGVLFGIFYSICQAAGSVLTRSAFLQAETDLLWSVILRLVGGTLFLVFWIAIRKVPLGSWARGEGALKTWGIFIWATFIGTYICLILQQLALKYAHAGIAQTLLMTSHLFILPIILWKGKKISPRAFLGALIGTGGIILLFIVK
ncbi:DMT family transporter [bacterium]|nr:DMT family transporter [bacterium]